MSATQLRQRLGEVRLARKSVARLRLLLRGAAPPADGVVFLFYHRVEACERGRFAEQLRQLRNYGDLTALSDAVSLLRQGVKGERRICLTFDDGYRDAYRHAVPALVEHAIPAAFFLVPGWIDERRAGIVHWDEAREMVAAGMEVGAHSLTHRRLSDLGDAELSTEFAAGRARIIAELGRDCVHFACPWGQPKRDYRPEREPAFARSAGYHSFFTTIAERATDGADPWQLPRIRMEPAWSRAELREAVLR